MGFLRNKKLLFIKDFIELCHKNKIWYCADAHTLLGAIKFNAFLNYIEKFQIFMTIESYEKLKTLFPSNVVDSSLDNKYVWNKPTFINDHLNWKDFQFFIEIRIVVPTTIKKWNAYLKNQNKFFFKKFDNIKNIYWKLLDQEHQFFYLIDDKETTCNWIKSLSFKRNIYKFYDFQINVPIEFNTILLNWFGKNWNKKPINGDFFQYPSPNFKNKEIL